RIRTECSSPLRRYAPCRHRVQAGSPFGNEPSSLTAKSENLAPSPAVERPVQIECGHTLVTWFRSLLCARRTWRVADAARPLHARRRKAKKRKPNRLPRGTTDRQTRRSSISFGRPPVNRAKISSRPGGALRLEQEGRSGS